MPRSTAKSKAKNGNVDVKSTSVAKNTRKRNNYVKKDNGITKGLVVDTHKEPVIEEVFHRKSERRRVARDIFLVFEEESSTRRKTRANKKQTKPKFGHLTVEDPIRAKGLLRDIKNEPKCYLNGTTVSVNATVTHDIPILEGNSKILNIKKEGKNAKAERVKPSACKSVNPVYSRKSSNIKSIKISTFDSQPCTLKSESKLLARVNPIFLWVKQDDTRIVEVRCEDYDKRNRIRITKTSNGWRAIPRSDPTTSRVLKFYPTPLMKVKRENIYEASNIKTASQETVLCTDFSAPNLLSENSNNKIDTKLNGINTVCNPLATENGKSKTRHKKSKKLKKKSRSEKTSINSKNSKTAVGTSVNTETPMTLLNKPIFTNSSNARDCKIQSSAELESNINEELTTENNLYIKNLDANIPVHSKCNAVDLESDANMINSSLTIDIQSESKSSYQESEKEISFHLCPKTGLFLPNHVSQYENDSNENLNGRNASKVAKFSFLNSSKEDFNINAPKVNSDSKIQISEDNAESLEAKTKNLKDLLDDADLLQNCDDSANSDAELIDTLVKTSCENNLIQTNEIITKATIDQITQRTLNGTNEMVVQLIADVSDPPKCLSFNEAGEIEGLNDELFQSNAYIEAFDKHTSSMLTEPQVMLHSTTSVAETLATNQNTSSIENIDPVVEGIVDIDSSKLRSVNEIENTPKDLSYKKREEVCPPSESRSHCIVTSSSDVIKSPQREETSMLASSSETLKNLILEQFMKLSALTTQHQREPIDIEKQRLSDISNIKSMYSSKSVQSTDFIETVIIEDDDENDSYIEHDEPLKKRLRLKHNVVTQNGGKLALIDKDPDPLTQLRLLIRNTQWKVPDPILVPKDRLSAVLASPAREIPLLITTRPELRLPEAFAYPEIIQNPNILVISMAQLEAILKNELEVEKATSSQSDNNQQLSDAQLTDKVNDLQSQSSLQHLQHSKKPKNTLTNVNTSQVANNTTIEHTDVSNSITDTRQDYAKVSQTDSPLTSDINSATMAVLNQMLWMPYFGQISQDIGKSFKNPMELQDKCASGVPFFNSQLNSRTNLQDVQKNTKNKTSEQSVSYKDFQNFHQQFKTNEELSLFQQIVQHQMHSVLQLNQNKADTCQRMVPEAAENAVSSMAKSKSKTESFSNLIEQRKHKANFSKIKQLNTTICKNQTNNCSSNIRVLEKSYNLRSSVAGRHSIESKQYSNNNQRQIMENKPRLTCKSLSNLLDPEHSIVPSSSSATQYVENLSSDFLRSVEIKRSSIDSKVNDTNSEDKEQFLRNASIMSPSLKSCSNMNMNVGLNSELPKQKSKAYESHSSNNDGSGLNTDTNTPLWHPLFGSNTKTSYSSPWQWTTVTATGE